MNRRALQRGTLPAIMTVFLCASLSMPQAAASEADFPTARETSVALAGLQKMRQDRLLARQPNVLDFMFENSKERVFDAHLTDELGDLSFNTAKGRQSWAVVESNWTRSESSSLQYSFASLGAHKKLNNRFYIGAMAELDAADRKVDADASGDGVGFLVGPYLAGRLPKTELDWSMRLLHGRTNNQFAPDGSIRRDAESQRTLFQARMEGRFEMGTTELTPNIIASHVNELTDHFRIADGTRIDGEELSLSQFSAGVEFAHPLESSWAKMGLTGQFALVAQHSMGTGLLDEAYPATDWFTSRVEVGVDMDRKGLGTLSTRFGVDGVEGDLTDQIHLSLMFERKL
ncbi:autotransporter domain-containing protein [Thioclava sp. GXIMD2076]|uniref:autotransporter domain-containing protein n=1 Tax=unclassified Thioclava TaxID=2621713 RepID=UPI0030D1B988